MTLIFLFIIGLCVGSFLNVLIDRIPVGKSVLFGRSQCDFCKKQLQALDLIPVFSYVFLQGRCRYCHKKLSIQYPLVEIATGILFIIVYIVELQATPFSLLLFIIDVLLVSSGFALTIMDIKYHILADSLLFFFGIFSFARILLNNPAVFPQLILVGLLSTLPLLLIFLVTQGKGMGFGDVKLVGILGFLLGFPNILITYYVAFLTGAVVGVILIVGRKKQLKGAIIAFGPFLFFGSAVASLFGNTIWQFAHYFLGF